MQGRKQKLLGEISQIYSGFAFRSQDLGDKGIPVVKIANIQNKRVSPECADRLPEELCTAKLNRYFLQPEDTLIAMTGAGSVGRVGKMPSIEGRFLVNQRVAIVRPDSSQCDAAFVYYALSQDIYETKLYGLGLGAGQPNVSAKQIGELEIPFPSLPIQQRIAGILSAYDELIENSQRRIRVLESMARALYREWFVHFRFPGHENAPFIASPLGEIPQGWRVMQVKELLARRPAGKMYKDSDVHPEGTTPVFDQSTNELLGFHDNEPDHQASPKSPLAIFGDHTCKMQLLIEPFSVGPNVVPFSAKTGTPTAYAFYAVNSLVKTQEYKRHWTPLSAKELVVADLATTQRFASLIQPLLVTQEIHRKTIRNLRRTRDLLLPRLLSGQINVDPSV